MNIDNLIQIQKAEKMLAEKRLFIASRETLDERIKREIQEVLTRLDNSVETLRSEVSRAIELGGTAFLLGRYELPLYKWQYISVTTNCSGFVTSERFTCCNLVCHLSEQATEAVKIWCRKNFSTKISVLFEHYTVEADRFSESDFGHEGWQIVMRW